MKVARSATKQAGYSARKQPHAICVFFLGPQVSDVSCRIYLKEWTWRMCEQSWTWDETAPSNEPYTRCFTPQDEGNSYRQCHRRQNTISRSFLSLCLSSKLLHEYPNENFPNTTTARR